MLRVRVSAQCNRCMHMDSHQKEAWYLSFVPSVLCMLFVFPVTILVLPGLSCDISDGFLIAWLMGSGSFHFDPTLPCPIHGLSNFPCLGKTCCFSGVKFRSKLFVLHELLGVLYHWFWLVNKFKLNIYHCQTYFCQDYLNCSLEFCMCQMRLVWYHWGCCHHYSVAIGNCLKSRLFLSYNISWMGKSLSIPTIFLFL